MILLSLVLSVVILIAAAAVALSAYNVATSEKAARKIATQVHDPVSSGDFLLALAAKYGAAAVEAAITKLAASSGSGPATTTAAPPTPPPPALTKDQLLQLLDAVETKFGYYARIENGVLEVPKNPLGTSTIRLGDISLTVDNGGALFIGPTGSSPPVLRVDADGVYVQNRLILEGGAQLLDKAGIFKKETACANPITKSLCGPPSTLATPTSTI